MLWHAAVYLWALITSRARPVVTPVPRSHQHHFWHLYDLVDHVLEPKVIPVCNWCGIEQTVENMHAMCPESP